MNVEQTVIEKMNAAGIETRGEMAKGFIGAVCRAVRTINEFTFGYYESRSALGPKLLAIAKEVAGMVKAEATEPEAFEINPIKGEPGPGKVLRGFIDIRHGEARIELKGPRTVENTFLISEVLEAAELIINQTDLIPVVNPVYVDVV